ncbi:hypothetical protein [Flavobacterium pedocola]
MMPLKLLLPFILISISCTDAKKTENLLSAKTNEETTRVTDIPKKNQLIVNNVKKYGPEISATYEKAVCTELVIQILEKVQSLNAIDKQRIRIITTQNIHDLLKTDSDIPKGVYYSLIEKGVGIPIKNINEVCEGDFVQFWTEIWGHCGIVKTINTQNNVMELYSSFPSTNGYGIQKFTIPKHSFFVRLK